LEDHLIDDYGETSYGVAIRKYWDLVSEVDRDLMLFSWAARQDYLYERNDFAHPKPTLVRAFDMIDYDRWDSPQLHCRALTLLYQSDSFV
jgi:hypothetical protein